MKTKDLKIWLIENDHTQAQIAREIGKTKGLVCHTVKGRERNKLVLSWLVKNGCPKNIIKLTKKEKIAIEKILEQEAA